MYTSVMGRTLAIPIYKALPCFVIYITPLISGPLPQTEQGNKYIVTVTDYFSKWPEAASLKDKTAAGVTDFLFSLFCRHGWPKTIISDQGREFVNGVTWFVNILNKL